MFVTGAPSDGKLATSNAFNIVDGVRLRLERSIFKIMGQYYNYEGEATTCSTPTLEIDYDSANSKYILYLSGYQGNLYSFR